MGGNSGRKKRLSAIQREERELEATAYHEAGHVVAALAYELKFVYVTIKPNEPPGSLGHVHYYQGLGKRLVEGLEFGLLTPRQC